ncbi:uncharacterized protein LOC131530823 isoform X2 [Onychostoma macrolepis]|uniref:uncharacterized protein LOC131530823 isoform X2 n=1 Tax=Onychostoma macrolepis TaxID=369639 RepID=UPI00272A8908|nr:uncharacterized protein LOC131530823 isoform X2 [Onychostoma macrolepis]
MLHICWFCLCLWHLVGVFGESVSVTEGDPVTLHTGLHKRMDDDVIQWMFGYKSIAKICIANGRITVNYVLNGRFRDRLKLDNQTGSLTITNTRPEHTGVYELQTNCLRKSFILTVQRCSSCIIGDVDDISVVEGYQFTLAPSHTEMIVNNVIQWRFVPPNALLAEINKQTNRIAVYDDVLDGRFRDRLKLDNQTGSLTITNITTEHTGVFEVQNNNVRKSYIFTVNAPLPVSVISTDCPASSSGSHPNPISNQTQHLDISKFCHTCSDAPVLHRSSSPTILLLHNPPAKKQRSVT